MPVYANPIRGLSPVQCACYHRQVLAQFHNRKDWQWDLIGRESDYFGNFDFDGKRVLEFGAADGYLSFWLEQQGAQVVATDLSPDPERHSWDVFARLADDLSAIKENMSLMMRRLNNTFWFGHEHHNSRAKMVHGTAYDIPREIGMFDVVILASILLHLRDPLRALENALEFTRDAIIITDLVPFNLQEAELKRPLASFMPNPSIRAHGGAIWWLMSPAVYRRYFEARGFIVDSVTQAAFQHRSRTFELFQIIARRP